MNYAFTVHLNAEILGVFSNIDKAEDFVYQFQKDNPDLIGNSCMIYRSLIDDMFSCEPKLIKIVRLTNLSTVCI